MTDVENRAVEIQADGLRLPGDLVLPADAAGVVVFAHGSGSSRRSPRNVWVAERLHAERLGTLLFDLLTEEGVRRPGQGVRSPARRAAPRGRPLGGRRGSGVPFGLFGASTGAGASLVAASTLQNVGAIVSRAGVPTWPARPLERVTAPTLIDLMADGRVLELNREAQARMRSETSLEIVSGATHLFEESGALERVADLAAGWFGVHPRPVSASARGCPGLRERSGLGHLFGDPGHHEVREHLGLRAIPRHRAVRSVLRTRPRSSCATGGGRRPASASGPGSPRSPPARRVLRRERDPADPSAPTLQAAVGIGFTFPSGKIPATAPERIVATALSSAPASALPRLSGIRR